MKTQYYTASSLDGFIADRRNGIDWLMQFGDDMTSDYPDFIKDVGALIMGSTTYEWMLENHVGENAPERMPWPYAQTTWVLTSRTLPTVPGADIRFVRGDVTPDSRREMKVLPQRRERMCGLSVEAMLSGSSTTRGCLTRSS